MDSVMNFIEKYKAPIMGAIVGALVAILLSYLINIPFWLTGAIIGASASFLTEKATAIYDEQSKVWKQKYEDSKAKKASASKDADDASAKS